MSNDIVLQPLELLTRIMHLRMVLPTSVPFGRPNPRCNHANFHLLVPGAVHTFNAT
jgi:hypothetical protein